MKGCKSVEREQFFTVSFAHEICLPCPLGASVRGKEDFIIASEYNSAYYSLHIFITIYDKWNFEKFVGLL